jgi:hypothetical protein
MTKQQWLLIQIAQFPELSARELTSFLNDKLLVNNPKPQGTIPLLPTLEQTLAILTPKERFEIAETWTYDRILQAVNQQNWDLVAVSLGILKDGDILSKESYDKLIKLLQQTQPDPSYQAQIWLSTAELAGFGVVLVNEIEELIYSSII